MFYTKINIIGNNIYKYWLKLLSPVTNPLK